ncbi:glutamate-1-semialdehyde 2,1-aminomutase [Comamonas sp. 4034]|uniref:glutamate-1-semialdehyde 2,1-aminomutase n=1 Tax=Comamonas sp. 4034 TaxID=3156455 RepID=UPI003D1DBB3B
MTIDKNAQLFERARQVIPGGVNSPVRAFNAVGGTPPFIARAQGAYLWDANGKQYVDYIGSWGPMILGHGQADVVQAVQAALLDGFSFGAPTEREVALSEAILKLIPSMDMVRLVSSGTEAGMSAIRLARGYTGRNKLIKFNGCYHGHADALLVKAGSGLATFGASSSAGVPAEVVQDTVVLEYNDIAQLEEAFAKYEGQIACVMMEPIAGNMNFVRATPEFTLRIRQLCDAHGALMIYDEVMTGFRVALGGAQSIYAQQIPGFRPDITVMGKVIGGGMPMAAFGARREIMEKLSPLGPVYQAGTLSGNPIATACGLKTLELISQPGFHDRLHAQTGKLMTGIKAEADAAGVPFCVDHQGGLFGFFLLPELPSNYDAVMKSDKPLFNKFFHGMLARGHYFAPALYEAGFVSSAHTDADIASTVEAAREVFKTL